MPLPSPDLTKNVSSSFFFFFESFLWVLLLSLSVYKTQNIITMEPNKQLWSGFLYVMPYSIFFALIKKNLYYRFIFHIKRILSHTATGLPPRKTDGFFWYAVCTTWPELIKLLNKMFHKPLFTFSSIVWRLTNWNFSMSDSWKILFKS